MEVLSLYYLPFSNIFLMFLLFSFVGWCAEVLYVGIFFEHKFINRGFLHGPICPIYGFGGLVILLLPQQLYTTWVPLFFASMILCTCVEYFVSWLLEKLFHTLWWDYSHYKFNINGRVCLLNSVLFGLMGVLGVHFIFPYVQASLNLLGLFWATIFSEVGAVLLTIDLLFTLRRLVDFNATMERIKMFTESLRDQYSHEAWFKNDSIMDMMQSVREHIDGRKDKAAKKVLASIEQIHEIRNKNIELFMKRFPTMKSSHYKEELILIRQKIKARLHK